DESQRGVELSSPIPLGQRLLQRRQSLILARVASSSTSASGRCRRVGMENAAGQGGVEMMKVVGATLRAYNVGFGDCLLLKLTYDDPKKSTRCVLFDFGSTKL